MGLEQAGHECVGFVEWDKFARKSYEAIYDTEGEWARNDITEITNEEWGELRGKVDLICGGFPCQSFSVAGKRGGFHDTRGTMFFEIARAAEQIKPRLLLLENVKGLLSHDKGRTFGIILDTLDELGYDAEWQVFNSKDFNVPQNRERIFIIGHFRGSGGSKIFPFERTNGTSDIPVKIIAHRKGYRRNTQVFDPSGITETLDTGQGGGRGHYTIEETEETKIKKVGNVAKNGTSQSGNVYDSEGLSPALCSKELTKSPTKIIHPVSSPDIINKNQNGRRFKDDGDPMFTLTAKDRHGVAILRPTRTQYGKEIRKAYENGELKESRRNMTKLEPRTDGISNTISTVQKDTLLIEGVPIKEATKKGFDVAHEGDSIRRLTPRECWRLQGFPDWAFDRAQAVNSDNQLYKQAGNAVTVNVTYELGKRLQ